MPHSTNRDADLLLSRLAGSVVALLFFVGLATTAHSQEITYNLTPTHKLGDEIWRIPIGGRLTMSADGSKMLVASIADSAFFVVNTANGEYRKLKARYYQNNDSGFTRYVSDESLDFLATRTGGNRILEIWDVTADTLISSKLAFSTGPLAGISGKHRLVVYNGQVLDFSAQNVVWQIPAIGGKCWFDPSNEMVYTQHVRTLNEYNALTGEEGRAWTIRPSFCDIRRPSNSDWIYVFSIRTEGLDTRNLVEAINLVTDEHLVFTDYYWSGGGEKPEYRDVFSFFSASEGTCFSSGIDNSLSGPHNNAIFEFDAESKATNVVLDEKIYFLDRLSSKIMSISPSKGFLCHTWFVEGGDSSNTVCQALVPNTVSVAGEEPGGTDPQISVAQTPSDLHITLMEAAPETVVENITLITTAGQTVVSMPVQQQTEPIVVPIAHVANGAYVLVLQTSQGQLSTKLLLTR